MPEKQVLVAGGLLLGACVVLALMPSQKIDRQADGLWRVEWTRTNGQIRRRERALWVIDGRSVTVFGDDGVERAESALRPETRPRQIDSSSLFTHWGIYEVRGDELWVARAPEIVPRPTDFDERRSLYQITVLRRVAPDPQQSSGGLAAVLLAEYGPRPPERRRQTFDRQAEEYVSQAASGGAPDPGAPDTGENMLENIQWLIIEVDNGGFRQFFFNSIGGNAVDVSRQLRLIGAAQTAALVDKGCRLFPDGKPATDLLRRRKQLESFTIHEDDVLNEMDEDFYARDEDLCLLLKTYLEGQPAQR